MAVAKKSQPLPAVIGLVFSEANNDAAKYARRLLDTIAISGHIFTALRELMEKYGENLPKCAVADIHRLADASQCIYVIKRNQTTKVSIAKGLLAAYHCVQKM